MARQFLVAGEFQFPALSSESRETHYGIVPTFGTAQDFGLAIKSPVDSSVPIESFGERTQDISDSFCLRRGLRQHSCYRGLNRLPAFGRAPFRDISVINDQSGDTGIAKPIGDDRFDVPPGAVLVQTTEINHNAGVRWRPQGLRKDIPNAPKILAMNEVKSIASKNFLCGIAQQARHRRTGIDEIALFIEQGDAIRAILDQGTK